jgi:hypothetical protein
MEHSGLTALQTLSVLAGYNPEIKKLYDKAVNSQMSPIAALKKAREIEQKLKEKQEKDAGK